MIFNAYNAYNTYKIKKYEPFAAIGWCNAIYAILLQIWFCYNLHAFGVKKICLKTCVCKIIDI